MSNAHHSAMGHDEPGEGHASYGSYMIGFFLSLILTAGAFAAVMVHAMSPSTTIAVISVLAIVQIFVHVVYFLHMNTDPETTWNRLAFAFAILVVLIVVFGFLFVMHDTAMHMMSR
ncbi:cytochrome o ubiquinol oxidase subunit IV [Acidomonas methanolica]|uniref:cytochrome o ubiquinol oxidase subunit IV n=1 Tax=Acidomonas methanolica TaxID=437 RepID=UPI00211A7746|nr:cytochrome o ubiquinol oxidase subunit IV [Acidomonas methanolica]MCQ9154769.1 cytochrome o ubiquinol oxidase subunit IV [Acidomonas methanolica]